MGNGKVLSNEMSRPASRLPGRLIFYTTVSEVIDYQRVAVLETA
jgi:hypothetical protein